MLAVLAVIALVCWQGDVSFLPFVARRSDNVPPDQFLTSPGVAEDLTWSAPHVAKRARYVARIRGVYPYSVVPGGVRSSQALREAIARDRAVARHYAHFDFTNAHLVQVTEPREVYVSYRIRDTIFWSRKKVRLHRGEMLLTDGTIAARAHCGNQISDTAKPDVSDQEPEQEVMEEPVALEPIGPSMPVRPVLPPPNLPVGQPSPPQLFAGGFYFPYISPVVPLPPPPCRFEDGKIDRHCHPHHKKKPVVPEPSTVLLLASGMAVIAWRCRAGKPFAA